MQIIAGRLGTRAYYAKILCKSVSHQNLELISMTDQGEMDERFPELTMVADLRSMTLSRSTAGDVDGSRHLLLPFCPYSQSVTNDPGEVWMPDTRNS